MPAYSIKPTVPIINRRLAKLYGVVAAWPFTERGGTVLRDVAGANNGTISGPAWTSTPYGPGLLFSASGAGVTAAAGAPPRSITAWIYVASGGSGARVIIGQWQNPFDPTPIRSYVFYIDASGHLAFLSSGFTENIDGGALSANTWYHVAYVNRADGVNSKLYVNGVETATTTGITLPTVAAAKVIGSNDNGINLFNGKMADVREHSLPLTAPQVRALYLDTWALYRQDRRNVFAIQRLSGLLLARRRAMLRL